MKQDRDVSDPMTFWWIWWFWRIWWIWWFWRIWWIWWFWWIWNLVKITETQDVCSWYAFCKSVIIEREASVITLNIKWSERKSGENYWKAGWTPSSTSPLLLSPSKCPARLGSLSSRIWTLSPSWDWQHLTNASKSNLTHRRRRSWPPFTFLPQALIKVEMNTRDNSWFTLWFPD